MDQRDGNVLQSINATLTENVPSNRLLKSRDSNDNNEHRIM